MTYLWIVAVIVSFVAGFSLACYCARETCQCGIDEEWCGCDGEGMAHIPGSDGFACGDLTGDEGGRG